jgi:hypothetical protein
LKEQLKKQLLENIDAIVDIISKGNNVEVKKQKDKVSIYEVIYKKINTENK